MASHLMSLQFNNETTRRRSLVRRAILESLERRDLMAADLLNLDDSSYTSSLTQSVLSQAELSYSSLNPNLSGYDITGFLDATLGGAAGNLTQRPWFGLVEQSYNNWSRQNDLAFSFTSGLHGEGEGEGSRLTAEGEAGGPRLLSVAPNSTSIFTFNAVNTLTEAPTELTLRFDDFIDTTNLNGIQLRSGGADRILGNSDDSLVTPGWIGAGDNSRIIIMRFRTTLTDGLYRLELSSTGSNAVRTSSTGNRTLENRQFDSTPNDPTLDTVDFRLQLGAKVLGVVPQPVDRLPNGTLSPQLNKIRVYFNDDKLDPASAQNINYYQLIFTADTVQPGDDNRYLPTSAVYNAAINMVELTFSHDIDKLPQSGPGNYRLRIGSNDVVNSIALLPNLNVVPEGADIAGNVQSANDLGTFAGTSSILRSGSIVTTDPSLLRLDFPGSNFELGHRDIQAESHLTGAADASPGITTIQYNFADNIPYGVNAVGQPLFSSVAQNPDQRQRIREAFDFYANKLGVTFQETEAAGLRVVVGDMFPINGTQSAPGGLGLISDPAMTRMTILDGAEAWDNTYGGSFFLAAMHGIGQLLGYGYTSDLPVGSVMRFETASGIGGALNNQTVSAFYNEPAYPGDHDVVHGQHMFRPDNRDVDTYRFVIPAGQAGGLRIESMAERLATSSSLDTHLTLFKMTASGLEVVATNDDSLSSDSYISLTLAPEATDVTYFLSITGKGNEDFNPRVPNTGSGAVTAGNYQLRINFDSTIGTGLFLQDTSGTALDGDGDGKAGGNFNFWFRAAAPSTGVVSSSPRTIYVDKTFAGTGNGSPTAPMNNLNMANWPAAAIPQVGDIIRVVGSTSANLTSVPAYEIGRGGVGNAVLSDGLSLQVPRGVTMMIDAGAIFKLQGSQIATGSATASADNSNSSLQVLGIPGTPVFFTSYRDEQLGTDTDSISTTPSAGDWGGIHFRENVDRSQGRFGWERQGIFLNYIAGADFRYGGGPLTVFGSNEVVAPITMSESRPTILNNTITLSADAAISADPNSFEETLFTTPRFQQAENFDPDYSRVGPDIRGNTIQGNSINGLFVRTSTAAGGSQATLTTPGKFDDTSVVHVLAENLIVDSLPGGPILDARGPDIALVQLQQQASPAGTMTAGTNARYKVTAVDRLGNSSPASAASAPITIAPGSNSVLLLGLPLATGDFVGRQLWRSTDGGVSYRLIAELDKSSVAYLDLGVTLAATLVNPNNVTNLRARPSGRLEIAPGTVIKATGSRIEASPGAQLIAEGTADKRIVFTSRSDDRYGAGGSFDTYNDGATNPAAGNWGGIIGRHMSSVSVDYALITFAGGTSPLPGGFAGFNALEVIQSDARIANTRFESNGDGSGGNLSANRVGRGPNDASVIRVVGSQPIIINNSFVNNSTSNTNPAAISNTAAISINARALNSETVIDTGRQTGFNDREPGSVGNVGPLIKGNSMSNTGINGMRVRGEVLTTESVWDDTDIVHVLQSEIVVPDFHTFGGLTLRSRFDEGLVVKLSGPNAGFTATGKPLDVNDRIGGSLRIIGTPGFPVVLTSLADDSVGSGNDITGRPLVDTNNNNTNSLPAPGNWRGISLLPYANDRNVAMLTELESDQLQDVGTNDTVLNPQALGIIARSLSDGDENVRLGLSIDGSIASTQDLDVYSFRATAGTQVWLDVDRTAGALDSVVELLDETGAILAQSNNSLAESLGSSTRFVLNDITKILPSNVRGLDSSVFAARNSLATGIARDLYSVNPLDAGMQILLPGAVGQPSTYYVRVRSSNLLPGDPASKLQDQAALRGGVTTGTYRLQVRLRQTDEVPGSTVQYADIRFATNGISAQGLPASSPLLGQISENGNTNLGNIAQSDRGSVSVAGTLTATAERDVYTFTVEREDVVSGDHVSVVFDIDYADGMARPDTSLWIFDRDPVSTLNRLIFTGTNSNISDDQAAPASTNNDLTDLTRGSAGTRDAYIGPVELIAGRQYTVVVTNNSQTHRSVLIDPANVTAGDSAIRREPIDSVRRISIDRFNPIGTETTSGPLQVTFSNNAANNRVEWNLSDMTTYVISNVGIESQLSFANAMTGAKIADVSQFPRVNDAAMSPDGRLVGFQVQMTTPTTDANGGNLLLINSTGALNQGTIATGGTTGAGASGIQTFTAQQTAGGANPTFAIQQRDHTGFPDGNTPQGDAIVFNALSFHTSGTALAMFGVGSRGNGITTFNTGAFDANGGLVGVGPVSTVTTNLVYRLDPNTGAAINANGLPDRSGNGLVSGAGTNKIEFGRFITAGVVQGLAEIGGTLFAVSNLGQLFRATVGTDPTNGFFGNVNPFTTIIDPETGAAVVFNGLTRGPRNLDNPLGGTFNNILFGTTSNGTIYAFNTAGVLQPVFPGFSYKTHVPGALGTVTGIDFSSLDVNLWHVTDFQNNIPGHGRLPTPTGSQTATSSGENSLYFGYRPADPGLKGNWTNNVYTNAVANETYNFAGGAHGAIVSNVVDLTNYSPDDQPMMYFNYLLGTEAQDEDFQQTERMRDAFRVYGAGDDGNWILLATNNTPSDAGADRGDPTGGAARNGRFDELDNVVNGNFTSFGAPVQTQLLYDNTPDWRQARVPLAALAGQANVRLRFEFSTGATLYTGDPLKGGIELITVAGNRIVDGTGLTLTPNQIAGFTPTRFEFEQGFVLAMPSGASLTSGVSTVTVNGTTFTFSTTSNAGFDIQYSTTDSGATISQLLRTALTTRLGIPAADITVDPLRANVIAIANLPVAGAHGVGGGLSAADIVLGTPGVAAGAVAIPVNLQMTANQVRDAMRMSFAQALSQPNMVTNFGINAAMQAWPISFNTIKVYKFDVTDNSAIGVTTQRIGDFFGVDKQGNPAHNDERAINNNALGVMIDDIIIGFAERGEMVLTDRASTITDIGAWVANPEYHQTLYGITQIETGNYQLTVRTAADYGTTAGQNLFLDSFPPLGRDFDTNARLAKAVAINVPATAVGRIPDGATFTLSDTKSVLTFEFDVTAGAADPAIGVAAGSIPVRITNASTAPQIAAAIRDAINSPTAQGILNITAGVRGQAAGPNAGGIVEIHGPVATDLNGGLTLPANTFLTATRFGLESSFGEDLGDVERERAQGQILLIGNTVRNSSNFGISATAAAQLQPDTSVARPYPGAPINFQTVNAQSWAPGVVIMNNILANNASGGVLVSDDPAAGTTNPIARIVNNTMFGGSSGVRVENNASPTILNNVFAGHSIAGIHFPGAATTTAVLGANLFQGTAVNPASIPSGSFDIQLLSTDPLFTSTSNNKFYLAPGSRAIDASANVSLERNELSLVKNPLGLAPSPILAPEIDVNGQGRRDDPSVNSPEGMGAEVFKDRGAVERTDFAGPVAVVLRPQDNDSQNNDLDRNVTYIRSVETNLDFFSILLQDSGTGPDPATVIAAAVVLTENGRVLREGSDYVLGYNANSRTLRLTPMAGIWRNDSVYEITLNNLDGHRVTVPSGAQLRDGDRIAVTRGATTTTFEFDNNGSATGTAIPFSAGSSAYELAALISFRLNLAGITSRLEGDGNLFITGASNVVATTVVAPVSIGVTSVRGIQDLAGNLLAPNRPTSLTQFTIVMPEAILDFGDNGGARIPTVEAAAPGAPNGNGSRHVILPVDYPLLAIGAWVDGNANGLPTLAADGDDYDVTVDFGTLGGVVQGTAGPVRLQMPAAAAIDGQSMSITDRLIPLVFRFDTTGLAGGPNLIIVSLNIADDAATVAQKFAATVRQALVDARISGVIPIASGNIVSLGGSASHQFNLSSAPAITRLRQGNVDLVIPTSLASLADGQTMSITDSRGRVVTFELNDTSVPTAVALGRIAVNVNLTTATPTIVAQAFVNAINGQVAAGNLSLGVVSLFGTSTVRIQGDDEDGVVIDGLFNAGSPPVASFVTATDFGMLDVWVDWNGDGDFLDPSEKVFNTSIPVRPGVNRVEIATPSTAVTGFTTARFRLSTLGGLLSTGVGIGGEVEDLMIEIAPGRPPVANNDSYSLAEDGVLTRTALTGVLNNDADADAGSNVFVHDENPTTVSVEPLVNVSNGTLVLNADGSFTYTPFLDFNGVDTFVYRATDGRLLSNPPATVTITVTPVNDTPDANDDTLNILEDEVVSSPGITFTGNDFPHFRLEGSNTGFHTNEAGQVLTLTAAQILAEATTSFGVTGTTVRFAARPGQGLFGTQVVFTQANLGSSSSAPQVTVSGDRIQITLNSNATTPSTINDVLAAVSGNAQANARITATLVQGNGATVVGNLTTAVSTVQLSPAGGTVGVVNNVLAYTPPAHYNNLISGPVKILLTIADDNTAGPVANLTATSTLTINIAALNDAPVFTLPQPIVNVLEDVGAVTRTNFVTNIASGPNTAFDEVGQSLSFQIFSNSAPALFTTQPTISSTGTLNFATAPHANGQAVIVVRLRDGGPSSGNGNVSVSTDQTFTINIGAVNDPPEFVISDPVVLSREDQGLVQVPDFLTGILPGPASATDEAGQAVTVTVIAADPSKFTVQPSIGADGRLVFQTATDVNTDNANLEVRVVLTDDGPAGAPNVNSVEAVFVIQATPVNDAPIFSVTNSNIVTDEDIGLYQEVMINGIAAGPATATDEVNQTLQFSVVSVSAPELFSQQPSLVRVGNSANGRLSFTTAPHKNGSSIVVARLEDGGLSSQPNVNTSVLQTFTITIDPINDAPEFSIPSTFTVDEDQGLVSFNSFATNVRRGPLGADDENGQIIDFKVEAVHPSLFAVQPRISVDGTLVFQVADNVNSINAANDGRSLAVVVFLEDDGLGTPPPNQNLSVRRTFTVLVNAENDPPQSVDFGTTTTEDESVTISATDVLTNAVGGPTSDELNQSVFMEQVERVSLRGGTIEPTFDANGRIISLLYTPPLDASGVDSFVYVMQDNGVPARSGTATINVTIDPINDAPQFRIGENQSSLEDVGGVTVNGWVTAILAGPFEAFDEHASQRVTFEVSNDNPGLFLIQPSVDPNGNLFYQAAADANGSAVIRVVAVDSGSNTFPNVGRSLSQSATLTVLPLNDAPVFTAGGNISILEDSGLFERNWATNIRPAAGLLAPTQRALDEQQQVVDFTVVVDRPSLFSVQPTVSSTGVLAFTPAQNASGNAILTIRAVDRGPSGGQNVNTSAPVSITISITGVNDRPSAVNDNYTTDENSILTPAAPGLLSNDSDVDSGDSITVVPATLKSNLGADVTINANGSFSYNPSNVLAIQRMTTNQSMIDTFTYTAVDAFNEPSNLAVVTVRVNGVNDAPIAANDQFSIGVGQTRLLEVLANDTDIDSLIDGRTIQITQVPIFGTVVVNQTGVVQYVAEAGFRGNDTFGYVVRDALGAVSNEAIVTVIVNNPPVANPDITFTYKNEPIVIPVLNNDSDQDGTLNRASVQVVVPPSPNGTATPQPNGTISFTPATNFAGEVTFSYVVSDNVGTSSNVARVTVRVLNSKWQNPAVNLDVNNDGQITPADALQIVNYLNDPALDRFLPNTNIVPPPFLDVDGNERVTPNDALLIINYLNERSGGGQGEGESAGNTQFAMMVTPQQMVDTVGAQVVREVERLLSQLREQALAEASGNFTATANAKLTTSSTQWNDDEFLAALAAKEEDSKKTKNKDDVDEFFADLGPQLI